jgi:hypothetical protein
VKILSGTLLVIEFTEEFTMGNTTTPGVGSLSGDCLKPAATQHTFLNIHFNEQPIRDAGMAAEISRFIQSQILYQANTAVYAQAGALNSPVLSMRDFG